MDNRRYFRQAMMLTLAVGLLASCSKDNVGEPDPDIAPGPVEIVPVVSLTGGDENDVIIYYPGPQDGLDEELTFFFARADETASGVYGTYTNMDGDAEITAVRAKGDGKRALTFSPTQYYQNNGLKTKLVGWYPQATVNAQMTNILTWEVDGSQDIMVATMVEGNNKAETINFDFKHVLAQLQFKAYAESAVAQSKWGYITSIKVLNQYSSYMSQLLTFDTQLLLMPNMMVPPVAQNNTKFEVSNINQTALLPTEKTNAVTVGNPVMILPSTNTGELKLEITTSTYPDPIEVAVPQPSKPYTAGEATTIYLLFKQGEVTVTLVPTDWRFLEDDAQDDVEVGENRSYVVKEMNYIVNRNMFGDAVFDDASWSVRPNEEEGTWTGWNDAQRDENEHSVPAILEVQAADQNGSSAYEDAVNACRGLGGGWRLPTITELELIYLYNEQLATPMEGVYWSATAVSAGEEAISKAYTIDVGTGESTSPADATVAHIVRCVRDVEMSNE